jgi:hypothetical protein
MKRDIPVHIQDRLIFVSAKEAREIIRELENRLDRKKEREV